MLSGIKQLEHTNNKEKPVVLKRDTWTLKEIEAYIDSLHYGEKSPIEEYIDSLQIEEKQAPIETKVKRRIRIRRRRKIKPCLESVHKKKEQKLIVKRRTVSTPRKIVSYGVIVVFSLLLLFYIILPTLNGSMHFLIVLSGSMNPEISSGDVVVSEYINPEEIKMNDVITFVYSDMPNNCITHRVINITNEDGRLEFQTKGDANEDPDLNVVQSSEVVGKVAFVIPYLGYLPHFAKSSLGFVTLIIIPGCLIIISETKKIIKNKKGGTSEKKIETKFP